MEFEVTRKIAVLSQKSTRSTEINLISWNGRDAKYDIRSWSDGGKPLKGITLTADEAGKLLDALKQEFDYEN